MRLELHINKSIQLSHTLLSPRIEIKSSKLRDGASLHGANCLRPTTPGLNRTLACADVTKKKKKERKERATQGISGT